MPEEREKKVWIAIGIIVVIIIGIIIIRNVKRSGGDAAPEAQVPETVQPTEDTSKGSIHAPAATAAPAKVLPYIEALNIYADRRIQIDNSCNAVPATVTYKNNTDVMIDNRSSVEHTFNVNGTFTVKAWGFKIVNLSSDTLPKTVLVDCDRQQNVAAVLIQK